ncbi:actin-associated protein FAM107A-like [Spea bombifrons]|uniref:actin-associated protein FAM107A-like n=1 Tax=Spea bombifrons TaxID=233779 RepID=UPI00234A3516|nr:actin-associated protein FAM107A-like [Spea bombifrons]
MWAKCQVFSSLRLPFGIGAMLPALKKAAAAGEEVKCDTVQNSTFPKTASPCKSDNPIKSSRTHQELHKELLLTYKKGLALHSKPELLRVLEKRRCQGKEGQDPKLPSSPLEQELQKWQQRREEREQESSRKDASGVHEFLRVRENLRKSTSRDMQSPPPPVS